MADNELDVRQLRKPAKHPAIFARYAGLSVGMTSSKPTMRATTAGSTSKRGLPEGLRYLTVHQKRQILPLTPTVRRAVVSSSSLIVDLVEHALGDAEGRVGIWHTAVHSGLQQDFFDFRPR